MLERHELETFLTLAEELHFARTAARLRVSGTRVSQVIRKLERQVGAPLFHRTSRRVELSAVGRRLQEQLRPAWASVTAAVEEAMAAAHGITGTVRVAYVGAAAGQLLTSATAVFQRRMPGCTVRIQEAQIVDVLPWLHGREVDLAFASIPVHDRELTTGPVLISEARLLAVPAQHPFARRTSVCVEDLADAVVLQFADVPDAYRDDRTPSHTPAGRPITRGPAGRTFNELLTRVGAGQGVVPVGEQVRRYYVRPDVTYVPIDDAPPLLWGLIWRTDATSAQIQEFNDAALEASGRK
ncbi:LysR family transcriptional regulator [Micromonospora fulviviridis]|nr:LysR family transcriptional regulator [Micromonospora fulviviridis]